MSFLFRGAPQYRPHSGHDFVEPVGTIKPCGPTPRPGSEVASASLCVSLHESSMRAGGFPLCCSLMSLVCLHGAQLQWTTDGHSPIDTAVIEPIAEHLCDESELLGE